MSAILAGLLWLKIKNTEISLHSLNKWYKLYGITLLLMVVTTPIIPTLLKVKLMIKVIVFLIGMPVVPFMHRYLGNRSKLSH